MINFFVHSIGDNIVRPTFFNDDGDNFWYDIQAPHDPCHYFWYPESKGYAALYFIGEGFKVPKWVKQGCGWDS